MDHCFGDQLRRNSVTVQERVVFIKDNDGENQGFRQSVIPSINFRKLALSLRREPSHHIPYQTQLMHQGIQSRRIHSTADPWALNQMQMWSS